MMEILRPPIFLEETMKAFFQFALGLIGIGICLVFAVACTVVGCMINTWIGLWGLALVGWL